MICAGIRALAETEVFEVQVLPAWRPDKAMKMEKAGLYVIYREAGSGRREMEIRSFAELKAAREEKNGFL